jgi:nucleoid DNA-binding protein
MATKRKPAIKEKYTKTQLLNALAEETELTRKQVSSVLDSLAEIMERHLRKNNGAGEITLPGLMKIVTVKKPARRERKGINPFAGEETTFRARPASVVVKVRPLKKLKDMAG